MRFILFLLPVFMIGCASSYKPLRPNASLYTNNASVDGIDFSYRLGILRETGNKKYAKREDSKAIRLSSVKITNNTDQPVTVGKDIMFYSGDSPINLLEPKTVHRELKQGVAEYVLFFLLTPLQLNTGDDSTPIGLVVGPGIAIGNLVGAGSANQNFLRELDSFNMINRTINPGETVFGLIGAHDTGYNPIVLKRTN
jgi:hypothetical protein